jgi:hypothetical protein
MAYTEHQLREVRKKRRCLLIGCDGPLVAGSLVVPIDGPKAKVVGQVGIQDFLKQLTTLRILGLRTMEPFDPRLEHCFFYRVRLSRKRS